VKPLESVQLPTVGEWSRVHTPKSDLTVNETYRL
jgi:hypothetical protein